MALWIGWASAAESWPGFRGPEGYAKAEVQDLLPAWPADGPALVWQIQLGDGGAGTYAGVIIVVDRAFIAGREADDDLLTCVDVRTGVRLWTSRFTERIQAPFGSGPMATPAVAGDRVISLSCPPSRNAPSFATCNR